MSKTVLILALALAASALAGCATNNGNNAHASPPMTDTPMSGPQTLDYVATQSGDAMTPTYTFTGPSQAHAGWTLLRLTNNGSEAHQIIVIQLPTGQTFQQHMAMMGAPMMASDNGTMGSNSTPMTPTNPTTPQNNTMTGNETSTSSGASSPMNNQDQAGMAAHSQDTFLGGVASTSPLPPPGSGMTPMPGTNVEQVWINLTPGTYVLECDIPGPAGVHAMHGMTHELDVTNGTASPEPTPDLSLTLYEYNFTWNATPTAGHHIIKVTNTGTQVHEGVIVHLPPGKTIQDFLAWGQKPQGPPPALDTFGAGALSPGHVEYLDVTFAPNSDYGQLCFLADMSGAPHALHGMIGQFHVA